jgi:undecaprenyl-diphosphatase
VSTLADWQAVILGIVQGITEPIPISSSGHLVIVPWLFGWPSVGEDNSFNKTFDVALHMGTLLAVVIYFWRDLVLITKSAWRGLTERNVEGFERKLPWYIALSAVPAALAGALLTDLFEGPLSEPWIIGVQLIIFGLVLYGADRVLAHTKLMNRMLAGDAAFIGVAQTLALMPGVSRSGITISAGLARGFNRESATRFAFLMSVPIIFGAGLFKGYETFVTGEGLPDGATSAFVIGIISSAVTGYAAIAFLIRYVRTHSFLPFVVYRCGLGVLVLAVVLIRG